MGVRDVILDLMTSRTPILIIDVYGNPAEQGSKIGRYNPKTGKTHVHEQNPLKQRAWRQDVIEATHAAREIFQQDTIDGAVYVVAHFRLPRPPSVSIRKRPYPAVKPDLDKIARNTLDGLMQAGAFRDDAQVIDLQVTKRYALDDPQHAAGARIYLGLVGPPEII